MTLIALENFIDGTFQPLTPRQLEVWDPAEGRPYAAISDSGPAEVAAAIGAAQQAFPAWAALSPSERAAFLERLGLS